jgi:hypothetical protein
VRGCAVTTEDKIRLMKAALDKWPATVPISSIRVHASRIQGKTDGPSSDEQRETLRAAGWRYDAAGWWLSA